MKNLSNLINILKKEGIGVIPTDTIYGIVGSALSKKAVERIYKIKSRNISKPFIILISSLNDLNKFGVKISKAKKNILKTVWPNKISVILPIKVKKYFYLHRGTNSLAFRYPKNKKLLSIIKKAGPLVAPSANPEGKEPAVNIKEAKKYFSDKVDFYLSKGTLKSKPSTLVRFDGEKLKIIRVGSVKINKNNLSLI